MTRQELYNQIYAALEIKDMRPGVNAYVMKCVDIAEAYAQSQPSGQGGTSDRLRAAAQQILHLHLCEQEGLSSGQPTRIQWLEAVDELSAALASDSTDGWVESDEERNVRLNKPAKDAHEAAKNQKTESGGPNMSY